MPSGMANPLDWEPAHKCLLSAVIVLPFTLYYAWLAWWVPGRPDFAAYINGPYVTRVMLPVQVGLVIPGWLTIAALAMRRRRQCRADDPLVHAVCQLFFGWFGFVSYALGSNTSLYPAVILLGGATFGLTMFARRPVVYGLATFCAILLSSIVLTQFGVIPYAPVLRTAPYDAGRLEASWLIGVGGAEFSTLVTALVVIYYVIDRWRDRERRLEHVTALIRQYVPQQVAQQISAGRYAAVEEHQRRLVTLVFADIKDFTATTDRLPPAQLSALLNRYMAEMTTIADRYGGTIDKFIGDAVMVVFGAPNEVGEHAQAMQAVRMAIAMQAHAHEIAVEWRKAGAGSFSIRIGINTGAATVGNFGSPGRMTYTAVGTEVNVAARLQAVCPPGSVLMSEATWRLVRGHIEGRHYGPQQLRGLREPVETYEVVQSSTVASVEMTVVGEPPVRT